MYCTYMYICERNTHLCCIHSALMFYLPYSTIATISVFFIYLFPFLDINKDVCLLRLFNLHSVTLWWIAIKLVSNTSRYPVDWCVTTSTASGVRGSSRPSHNPLSSSSYNESIAKMTLKIRHSRDDFITLPDCYHPFHRHQKIIGLWLLKYNI